eukprot:COSAG02_NODE_4295_length_5539_cov_2.488235_7_plen_53_part_00
MYRYGDLTVDQHLYRPITVLRIDPEYCERAGERTEHATAAGRWYSTPRTTTR